VVIVLVDDGDVHFIRGMLARCDAAHAVSAGQLELRREAIADLVLSRLNLVLEIIANAAVQRDGAVVIPCFRACHDRV
jgi:hypothetical protein